ncbi:Hint domain-containing protein [Bombella saccharophila]|uniref:Hint domain-containing protein n=1 Tax=Bombella saccharophila TaxID=2967338 RepID=A0ABT3W7L9_9PROT|nr:Hint domain-containing protein [Bombella saccharophila]MCX5613709.1 Hint domain-containing protein [Bombella saccharophila]
MSNPRPVVTLGTYSINVAALTVDKCGVGHLSDQRFCVKATFTTHTATSSSDKKVQDFCFTDPKTGRTIKGSYDYSWGNKAVNGFIIGDGSGGYYLITSARPGSSSSKIPGYTLLDPCRASYCYVNKPYEPWCKGNFFILNLNGCVYYFTQDNSGSATDGCLGWCFTFDTCFLAGSLIETPEGYKKIEALACGDMVMTYDPISQQKTPQPITWLGHGQVNIDPTHPLDMAGYPVRITKNAIAAGIPFDDLLVTAEHCLFFEGHFVPARMMVNGRSIYFETSETVPSTYDIYHLETETHNILSANEVLTESYLNTGHRDNFETISQTDTVTPLSPSQKLSWQHDAAAPLCTTQAFVEPLHRAMLERAERLGVPLQHPYKYDKLSDDPEFALMTDQGDILREQRTTNGYKLFTVPRQTRQVTLVSRTSRPYDVHGPFVDDRRQLGILVGEITYFKNGQSHAITDHLTTPDLDGWLELDPTANGLRWTEGTAILPLPDDNQEHSVGHGLLAIKVVTAGPYLDQSYFLSEAENRYIAA